MLPTTLLRMAVRSQTEKVAFSWGELRDAPGAVARGIREAPGAILRGARAAPRMAVDAAKNEVGDWKRSAVEIAQKPGFLGSEVEKGVRAGFGKLKDPAGLARGAVKDPMTALSTGLSGYSALRNFQQKTDDTGRKRGIGERLGGSAGGFIMNQAFTQGVKPTGNRIVDHALGHVTQRIAGKGTAAVGRLADRAANLVRGKKGAPQNEQIPMHPNAPQ